MTLSIAGFTQLPELSLDQPTDISLLFEDACRGLYRYVMVRVGGDSDLANDVMQQLWVEIKRSYQQTQVVEFEPWARGIARNLIRRHWRLRNRQSLVTANPELAAELADQLDRTPLPTEMLERQEVKDQIWLALTQLPTLDQDIVIRFHFRKQSQQRIAEELKLSLRAVEGRLYRARNSMKSLLAHLDPTA